MSDKGPKSCEYCGSPHGEIETRGENVIDDKWLIFALQERKPKTLVYAIISKCSMTILGHVKWFPAWRHYCFFPVTVVETVHSDRCLLAISQFITKLNDEHKVKLRETETSRKSITQKDVKKEK